MLAEQDTRQRLVIALCLAVTAVALAFLAWRLFWWGRLPEPPERVSMAYFFDQNTGELFELPADTEGPIEMPSGKYRGMPAGVLAHVFSCTVGADPSQRFVGWLEAPLSTLQQAGAPLAPDPPSPEEVTDTRIRSPASDRWVHPFGPDGKALFAAVRDRCDAAGTLKYCQPPRRLAREVEQAPPGGLPAGRPGQTLVP